MKIGIDIGHNTKFNAGAKGVKADFNEDRCTMEVGTILMNKLRAGGHTVVDCLPRGTVTSVSNSLEQRTAKANREGCEIFVSIHFNAFDGNATGTEVLYKTDSGEKLGKPILTELVKALGLENRGMKFRSGLAVLNGTKMPAVIVESLFVDNAFDMKKYNAEIIAEAIYKGITGKSSVSKPENTGAAISQNPQNVANIKNLQLGLNVMNFTDDEGKKLVVDGIMGPNTLYALTKLKEWLNKI